MVIYSGALALLKSHPVRSATPSSASRTTMPRGLLIMQGPMGCDRPPLPPNAMATFGHSS